MVKPSPAPAFSINSTPQCQNNNAFAFTNASTNLLSSTFEWSFGDGQTSTDTSASHTYANYGSFPVKLKVFNPPGCYREITKTVNVIAKPVAAFTFPPVVCEDTTLLTLTESSYVPGGTGSISRWWWDIGGNTLNVKNPPPFTPVAGGPLVVKLAVSASQGCASDTLTQTIHVRFKPIANFTYPHAVCDNQSVVLKDGSYFAAGALGEQVTKWDWTTDTLKSAVQNPVYNLTAGSHHVTLVVESSYGCKSQPTDAFFIVNPKPHIRLSISDSCVLRNIQYKAIDLDTNVSKWSWNFGQGAYDGPSQVTKTFPVAGDEPLTLTGRTAMGCEDTIVRPFTIYDNKAFAGRDTLAAMNQPVQLDAHGGANVQYTWTPATGLNNPFIENPIATYDRDVTYKLDAISDKGCDAHSKLYIKRMAGPALYVPTAFTPNGDGLNDVLRVFPVGIRSFSYFAVYNRFGQRIFYTTDFTKGWDGRIGGVAPDSGTYVFVASAIDYRGEHLMNKGTVVLMR